IMKKILPLLLITLLPFTAQAASIGGYNAGCISDAKELPADGYGYQTMRLSRQRNYGSPEMVDYITKLGSEAKDKLHSGLLIGDIGQSHGGPMPSGHASHQTGLDVDIWFMPETKKLTLTE